MIINVNESGKKIKPRNKVWNRGVALLVDQAETRSSRRFRNQSAVSALTMRKLRQYR